MTLSNARRPLPDKHTPADQWLTFAEWETRQTCYVRFDRDDTSIDAYIVVPYTYCPNVADILDDSNHAALIALLDEANGPDGEDYIVRHHGHWATPYDMILVRPGTVAFEAADKAIAAMANYPVLDDQDFSERENEAAHQNIRDAVSSLSFECLGTEIDSDSVADDLHQWYSNNGNWGFLEDPSNRSVRDSERDEGLEALGWTLHDDDVYRRLA